MADTRTRTRRLVGIVIRFLVAAGLIAWLVSSGRLAKEDLLNALQSPGWVVIAGVIFATATFVSMVRWWVLLAAQGVRLRAMDIIHLSFIGFVFSSYIPGAVTGDVVKAYYISRETHNKAGATMSVVMDRVLGLFVFVTMAAVSLSVWIVAGGLAEVSDGDARTRIRQLAIVVIAVSLMMLLGIGLLWSRKLRRNRLFNRLLDKLPFAHSIGRIYDALHVYRDKPGHVAVALMLSLLVVLPIIISQYFCGLAVGEESLSLGEYFFLGAIGVVVNAIPLGPMGIGSGQIGYAFLFQAFGSGKGAAVITVLHMLMFAWNQVGWIFYLRGREKYRAALKTSAVAISDEDETT